MSGFRYNNCYLIVMSRTTTMPSSNAMTHYGLAKLFLSLNHSTIIKIAIHAMNAQLFLKRKWCKRVLNFRSTPNAQAARILAPVYILIVNFNSFHARSQTPRFHLLIESSRFTLTSLWIILRIPGVILFLSKARHNKKNYLLSSTLLHPILSMSINVS